MQGDKGHSNYTQFGKQWPAATSEPFPVDVSFSQGLLSDSSTTPVLTRCVPFGKSHNLSGPPAASQLQINLVCWGLGYVLGTGSSAAVSYLLQSSLSLQGGCGGPERVGALPRGSQRSGLGLAQSWPGPLSLASPHHPHLVAPGQPTPTPRSLPSAGHSSVLSANDLHVSGIGFPSSGSVPLGTEAPSGLMLPGRGLT